ncbi:methylenetetrahydrofolate--tRNA-(uracil(54)-C(5))-methyltransferase (FADH(2)-oxidizing) TrmFO [uncultured Cetobacterium sp.]|uniref:methylenetetrahydrofolate--tRNA-(uracil(54)- C(5))-methyltransferase (FADH(2)-oxidizing) TrmFO n=1 Tax=uncultured Cetobacterium sp. TaxID=527638 RepID=UPI002637E865|nr:methylenetetrahydrofolate--tRNA-(uracil(54)-C(5))-methyltransferase (FADH(2)-oxidizing) TrmFO [uncultured Cetobacterium sp.]
MDKEVIVIGAGLAGSEAAYQLAKHGIKVKLYEMRPKVSTEAHKSEKFAELVCSNSLGGDHLGNASGLMKEELRRMGSLLIEVADQTKVPAGQALAVDREGFSEIITEKLKAMENIEIINEELKEIPKDKVVLVASGPLTSEALSKDIMKMLDQEYLYFYDAAAPIVTLESIDQDKVYYQSRYGKGDGEYINCPMNQEEYETFYNALITGERVPLKQFEEEKLFEACMPVERIAQRGIKTLLFGPLKPKGLVNPKTEGDKWDHAVVQLRQDDKDGKLYNLVGFQTNLKFGEQKRIFSMIPGLENAEFVRYGVMHRNTFIDSTKLLTPELNLKKNKDIYFAGQITGGEGYVCAMATGLVAAINIIRKFENKKPLILDDRSSIGAIIKYITEEKKNFQPMGPNFGVIKSLDERIRDKKEKYNKISTIALEYLEEKLSEDMN